MTPYERLKSLPGAGQYLKPGITFEVLDTIALEKSDNEFVLAMKKALDAIFILLPVDAGAFHFPLVR